MRRLLIAGGVLWIVRWVAIQVAGYAGRHWLPVGPSPRESPRQPGRMPGPFD
jgi:hypothetical protein